MPMKLINILKLKKNDKEKSEIPENVQKETTPLPMSRLQKKLYACYAVLVLMGNVCTVYAYATNDPLTVVNNLSTFIFSLIRAIGLILLGFGIVQVGLSLKSHDPSQRANGFLTLAGGIIITFAKEILDLIMA
jgi:hypothetical protein